MTGFITPPNHVNFLAKKLFANSGEIYVWNICKLNKLS